MTSPTARSDWSSAISAQTSAATPSRSIWSDAVTAQTQAVVPVRSDWSAVVSAQTLSDTPTTRVATVGPRVTSRVGGDGGTGTTAPISAYQGTLGRTASGSLTLTGGKTAAPSTSGAQVGSRVTSRVGGSATASDPSSFLGNVRPSATGSLTLSGTARYVAGPSASAPTLRSAQPLNYQANQTITFLDVVIPADTKEGDVILVALATNQATETVMAPEGWTGLTGIDRFTSTPLASYTFGRTATVSDAGKTHRFIMNVASRVSGVMGVIAGATLNNYLPASRTDAAPTATPAIPTLGGIQPNSMVLAIANRRLSQTYAADFTEPSGWGAGPEGKTAFTGSPNFTSAFFYRTSPASGDSTVGGGTYTSDPASFGATYLVVLPPTTEIAPLPAQANGNIDRAAEGTLALSQLRMASGGTTTGSASGTLALAGRVGARGAIALSTEATVALAAGKPGYVGTIALSATGTVGLTRRVGIRGAFALSGVGTLSLFGTPDSATAKGGALVFTSEGTVALRASKVTARGTRAQTAVGTLALTGKPAVSGSLATSSEGSLAWAVTIRNSGSLTTSATTALTMEGLAKIARTGVLGLRSFTDLVLEGRARSTAFFYRALKPIYLGPGSGFAQGYNINDYVPNEVVFANDLTEDVYLTNN